ncbi:serine/threonine-protein kinase [Nocardia sp. CDC153]|uniref:serine/threonine-protein kinase n=1 Tax=Nocardia sp. CDC153 TaxID=3112167 RepID=UPI002DB65FA8|nr:serine/threonine-protein kinase [Nocardia sp. CDC153]MEC3952621.1 serine/threonine-protein kinase [Nocardia sp. CDC153]
MRLINGRYELRGLVGKGGMAEVWDAWDRQLRRQVAVKVLDAGSLAVRAQDEQVAWQRFEREARIAAQMNCSNIVMLHDSGVFDENGCRSPFLVMEFIHGENLRQYMRGRDTWALPQIARILTDALSGLVYAHSKQVVHRDIKPENIMICRDGTAKLADFGIAIEMRENMQRLTRAHQVVGTQNYSAPEYLEHGRFTHLSDVYSFAVVCTEVLEAVFAPANLPPRLKSVLDQALSPDPALRFQSAAEFQHYFRDAVHSETRDITRKVNGPRPDPTTVPVRSHTSVLTGPAPRTNGTALRPAEHPGVRLPATGLWGIFVHPALEYRQRVLEGLTRDDPRYIGGVLLGAALTGIVAGWLVFVLLAWVIVTLANHL